MLWLKNLLKLSLIRYAIVGVGNTVFGLSIIFLVKYVGAGDLAANATGYFFGLLLGFRLNSKWTFRYRDKLLPAFYRFCAVIGTSYLLNLAVVFFAIQQMAINAYVSQAMGVIPYTIFSYLGLRYLVFPEPKKLSC